MRIEGHIDLAGQGFVAGWIADRENYDAQFQIEVILRDSMLGVCIADVYRPDLEDAGIGDGCHGFKLPIPSLPQTDLDQISVRLAGSTLYLQSSRLAPQVASAGRSEGYLWLDQPDWLDKLALKHREGRLSDEFSHVLFNFARDGYYIVRGAVEEAAIDVLNSEIDALWQQPPAGMTIETFEPDGVHKYVPANQEYRSGQTKLLDLYAFSKLAREAIAAPQVVRLIKALFEEKPKAIQSQYFDKSAAQQIHKDSAYVKVDSSPGHLVGSCLALEDIQPGSGELVFYTGSHLAPRYLFGGSSHWAEHFPREHDRFLASLEDDAVRYKQTKGAFHAKKGDVMIWHGDLANGEAPVLAANATRRTILTHWTGVSDEPFYRRDRKYQPLTTEYCVFVSSFSDVHDSSVQ